MKVDRSIVFFPLMQLAQLYQLKYGEIGPIQKLIPQHPILAQILPALARTTIDGHSIQDPVVAISMTNSKKLLSEIECISFITASHQAANEIFGQKTIFGISSTGDEISVNQDGSLSPIEGLKSVWFPDFPKDYRRWDIEALLNFDDFFARALATDLYSALTDCLSDVTDKETRRERSRILISVALFNQAHIDLLLNATFSSTQVVLVAAAFEALLNLPSETIQSSFQNAVMTLAGGRTVLLKKWCVDFYEYRSGLVHGDLHWENEGKQYFHLPNGRRIDHSIIASNLFVRCLKAKLFLAGLIKNYETVGFSFENLIPSWDDIPTSIGGLSFETF